MKIKIPIAIGIPYNTIKMNKVPALYKQLLPPVVYSPPFNNPKCPFLKIVFDTKYTTFDMKFSFTIIGTNLSYNILILGRPTKSMK